MRDAIDIDIYVVNRDVFLYIEKLTLVLGKIRI